LFGTCHFKRRRFVALFVHLGTVIRVDMFE
jgi:hypothetical protein